VNVTVRLLTPQNEIRTMLTDSIVGKGEQIGYMFTEQFDPVLREVGDQIITLAKANLAVAGSNKEVNETVERIKWARQPIRTSDKPIERGARSPEARGVRVRGALVVSDHPASVRFEYGTAARSSVDKRTGRSRTRSGYTAIYFMRGAGMAAASSPGRLFEVHVEAADAAEALAL
jgi:hypothetical protein